MIRENACPAIIDSATFQKVRSLLGQRAFARIHPRRISSQYLLSGLAHCGHCGKALIGLEAKSGQFPYYVCGTLTRKGAGSCPARYINARKLEGVIIDKIKGHVLTPGNLTRLAEMVTEELNSDLEKYEAELQTIESAFSDVNSRLGRLYEALETGKITLDDLAPRIRELRENQEKLRARKEELHMYLSGQKAEVATREEVAECAADLKGLLDEGSLAERKTFIRSFINEIKVTNGEVLLNYTIPILPSKIQEEKVPVLGIVHYGGPWGTVPELLFERKQLIPALQQLILSH